MTLPRKEWSLTRRFTVVGLGALALTASGAMSMARAAEEPIVAAAADLSFALTEIADLFTRQTGRRVKLSFGSSGNFTQQILQGAPFELFLSADEAYVRRLAEQGRTLDNGALYAIGRIVLFVPKGSPVVADADLKGLAGALAEGKIKRFAIASPEHAPYGRAAREALLRAGLWDGLQGKLVLGENASQAAQFATAGSAEGGIIPYSLAIAPSVSALGTFVLLPADAHEPLRQRMTLITGGGDTARQFYDFVQQPAARAIFDRYGFLLPPSAGGA